MRIGFVALTDAAPLVVAQEHGLFAEAGVTVELHREIGWATIRDKIIYGELEAAHAPAPLLWSAHLGLQCPACEVETALVLNLHGNAITLSRKLWQEGVRDDASLRRLVRERRQRQPLTFGVVFPFSSHHLLLRSWLRAAEIDPDRDVRIVIVPPAQVFRNLAAGTIDGFCAGEPWNTLAVRERIGWVRVCSAIEARGQIEKVLMVRKDFSRDRAQEHAALVRALVQACAWCDEPHHREPIAELLASPRYLNVPAATIAPALLGRVDLGTGATVDVPEFHIFHRGAANEPSVAKAEALQAQLCAHGILPPEGTPPELPRQLFREDLYRELVPPHSHHASTETSDLRGVTT